MKRILLLGALFCLNLVVKAQKVYFIYLQSETSAPFYVKMGGKIQSSTTSGYLILSKLIDSTYTISIGQPGKQEEPRFAVTISRGDRGFLLKNIDGSVSLFDLQTLAIYKPINTETTSATQTVTRNDNFTKLLARAADDSTLLSQPVVQQVKPKPEAKPEEAVVKEAVVMKQDNPQSAVTVATTSEQSQTAENKETAAKEAVVAMSQEPKPEVKKEEPPQPVQEDYTRSIVTKKSETANTEGLGLVFLDTFNGDVDTIAITIPNQKSIVVDTAQQRPVAEAKQFLDITNVAQERTDVKDTLIAKAAEPSPKPKSQCTDLATDDDFFKLRRDMAAGKNDDEMIAQAKKYFKSKCYRTEQIKFLSTLFLTDEGKYHFYDAAYRHVSDQGKFVSLQSEIQDVYYVNRFKALIGN